MKINRKEIKTKAKSSVKNHYFIFVISLLLCAVIGVMYSSSTYIFTILKGGNEETYNEITSKIAENAHFNEDGELVINNSIYDSSNDIAEEITDYIYGKKDEALNIENQVNTINENQPDEHVGIITLGYKNGVLASLVNSFKSGSIILTLYKSVSKVVSDPSVSTIIVLILGVLIYIGYRAFVKNALWLTTKRQFVVGQTYEKITARSYLFLFGKKAFFRACFTFIIKDILVLLWSLTIVGGIIKHFSYFMTSYILAENPRLNSKQAITLSRKMMNGHKWELFVLCLTFVGWEILNILTSGLLGLFFLNPYLEATYAQFYLKLRKQAIDNKIEGYELLNDRFICKKPTIEEINVAYADLKEIYDSSPSEPEKYTGIKGFFANVLGIVLYYNAKVKRINKQEEILLLAKMYSGIAKGKLYPERLHPLFKDNNNNKKVQLKTLHYLRRYSVLSIISIFFIGCLIGWLWEVTIHLVEDGVFVNRGVLHGPWLPIYGTGAIMILVVLYKFRKNPWLEFLTAVILCGIVEYFTSWFLEITHNGQKWWDYTGYFLNINGRVCAEGLLVFGIAGIACVYVLAPLIDNFIQKINTKILLPVVVALLLLFAADNIYSHFYPNTGKGITDYDQRQTSQIKEMHTPNEVHISSYNKMIS